jgi:hypothetical protein
MFYPSNSLFKLVLVVTILAFSLPDTNTLAVEEQANITSNSQGAFQSVYLTSEQDLLRSDPLVNPEDVERFDLLVITTTNQLVQLNF